MVNKCVVICCDYNYEKRRKRDAVGYLLPGLNDEADKHKQCTGIFHFPKNDEALNQKWVKFVNRKEWKPSNNSVICSGHFESKNLLYGKQRIRLNFELDPVPTIYPANHIPQSSMLPSVSCNIPRKAPRDRSIPHEYVHFVQKDKINDFDSLDQICCPDGFTFCSRSY